LGKFLLVLSSLSYGLLIALVSINFPSGLIVGIIYCVLFGLCVVGGYVVHQYKYRSDRAITGFGNRPIVHHFLLSYVWGIVFIIIWIGLNGGLASPSQGNY
jgi:hypothetical protein